MKEESIPHFMGRHWKVTAGVAATALAGIVWGIATSEPTPPAPAYTPAPAAQPVQASFSEREARMLCVSAFKYISKDPDKAEIPYVKDMGTGAGEYFFAWGPNTKHMRMRNGLGLDVATTGSCIVSTSTRKITSMTVNGKPVL